MIEHTLLINGAFALRQNEGKPVYTEIKYFKKLTVEEAKEALTKLKNKKRDDKEKTTSRFILRKREKTDEEPPENLRAKTDHNLDMSKLKRIILTPMAKGYISTAFIDFAKAYSIPIYWIDGTGMIEACFMPSYFRKASLIIKQCEARITGKNIEIAKYIIGLKLESQGMNHLIPKLDKAKSIKDILQVEGNASRTYYQQWEFSDEWLWDGRHGKTSINANAVDPVNSALNLGYTLLAQQMSEILLSRGFELSIGFMHHSETSKNYWNMLTFDMIEPYRIWIDDTIKDMIADSEIKPTDFTFTKDKNQMVFKDNSFKIALKRFTDTLEPLEHKSLPLIRKIESALN